VKRLRFLLGFLIVASLGIFVIFSLPPVKDQVGWRVADLMARFKYAISPPEEVVFVPQQEAKLSTKAILPTSPTPDPIEDQAIAITPSTTPSALSTPTKTLTPFPQSIQLTGFQHEYQTWKTAARQPGMGFLLGLMGISSQLLLLPSPTRVTRTLCHMS
jgi:hypothetical protein